MNFLAHVVNTIMSLFVGVIATVIISNNYQKIPVAPDPVAVVDEFKVSLVIGASPDTLCNPQWIDNNGPAEPYDICPCKRTMKIDTGWVAWDCSRHPFMLPPSPPNCTPHRSSGYDSIYTTYVCECK